MYGDDPGLFDDFRDKLTDWVFFALLLTLAQTWASLKCYESLTAIFWSFFIILWASFSTFFLCCSMERFSLSAIFCCLWNEGRKKSMIRGCNIRAHWQKQGQPGEGESCSLWRWCSKNVHTLSPAGHVVNLHYSNRKVPLRAAKLQLSVCLLVSSSYPTPGMSPFQNWVLHTGGITNLTNYIILINGCSAPLSGSYRPGVGEPHAALQPLCSGSLYSVVGVHWTRSYSSGTVNWTNQFPFDERETECVMKCWAQYKTRFDVTRRHDPTPLINN